MNELNQAENPDMVVLCSECQTGALRLKFLTYFTWLNDQLITVQNFPSWVCDLCGRREYDGRAVKWLNTLLNPATGRRSLRAYRRLHDEQFSRRPQP